MTSPEALIRRFATPYALALRFRDVSVEVRTNDEDVWARLAYYYGPYATADDRAPAAVVHLIQGRPELEGEFVDLERPDGKPVKEAVQEWPGGRLILKRHTGVLMGLWPGQVFAIGDLCANLNQAVNLINACYAKAMLGRGYLLLHAAGVSRGGRAVALAGPAGAGKSTASLHLVEAGFRFLSNDRVLARVAAQEVDARGYPKLPRVNPGTLLHHPRLACLLKPDDRRALETLPQSVLWRMERKSDVDLDVIYGKGTMEIQGCLEALVLLRWRLGGTGLRLRRLETAEALANVPFFAKDLGAFDLDRPARAPRAPGASRYADLIGRLTVLEISGMVNFPALIPIIRDLLPA